MSLEKAELQPTGVSVEYWKVDSAVIDLNQGMISVTYSGYLHKAAFEAGNLKILTRNANASLDDKSDLSAQIIAFLNSIMFLDVK